MNVYTMEDWLRDCDFKAQPGQEISQEIYDEMFNVMPPLRLPREKAAEVLESLRLPVHAGFMMGEPHSSDKDGALYLAFGKNNYGKGDRFFYLGLSHKEKPVKNGTYFYFETIELLPNDGLMKETEYTTEKKALRFAKDHEATLYKVVYHNNAVVSKERLYVPICQ